jgi:uncharacterized protein GlcG (DUF336 family)
MANVVKKYSIASELAHKRVDEAVAKVREIGIAENVAILDDGGNFKAFSRMDGAPILSTEIAQNKAYTALFGVPTQDCFNSIQGDPSLLAGIPTLARVAAYGGGFPIKVDGEIAQATRTRNLIMINLLERPRSSPVPHAASVALAHSRWRSPAHRFSSTTPAVRWRPRRSSQKSADGAATARGAEALV